MSRTAYSLKAVTPNDSADIPEGPCTALWVGVGGNVALTAMADASSVVMQNVPAGTLLLVETKRVLAAGTTATGILAVYA